MAQPKFAPRRSKDQRRNPKHAAESQKPTRSDPRLCETDKPQAHPGLQTDSESTRETPGGVARRSDHACCTNVEAGKRRRAEPTRAGRGIIPHRVRRSRGLGSGLLVGDIHRGGFGKRGGFGLRTARLPEVWDTCAAAPQKRGMRNIQNPGDGA